MSLSALKDVNTYVCTTILMIGYTVMSPFSHCSPV